MRDADRYLRVPLCRQPDETSCGPACLAQVFGYFGDARGFPEADRLVRRHADRGTLAVWIGLAAIEAGYRARLAPLGVRVFDPTWAGLPAPELAGLLRLRAAGRTDPIDRECTDSFAEFLHRGGAVDLEREARAFLLEALERHHPVVCGLSATWLYGQARCRASDDVHDAIHGEPVGHFVVVEGVRSGGEVFDVADPGPDVPFGAEGRYSLDAGRLIQAILLGDITRDACLLEIWPEPSER